MLDPVRQAGYDPQWLLAGNQSDYLTQLQSQPDLILVDGGPQDLAGEKALSLII